MTQHWTPDPPQSFLKSTVRDVLRSVAPAPVDALIVSSFGRAGSTLVHDALMESVARRRFGIANRTTRFAVREMAWDLSETRLRPGVVYKSHDYPDALSDQKRVRAIFLFGSAMDAALSVHQQLALRGPVWVQHHFDHLHSSHGIEDLFHFDALGIEAQLRAWSGFTGCPVLCLRYEALWDNIDRLSEFCGVEVNLPPKRTRSEKQYPDDVVASARKIYSPIDTLSEALPDCFIASPDASRLLEQS